MGNRALRRGNTFLALVHAAQAAVILALSTDFSLPVTGAFMQGQPGSGLPTQELLFDLRIGPLVGAFLLLAMLTGISDYVALLALFAVNAAMIFFGWLMELLNPPDRIRTRWLPFALG